MNQSCPLCLQFYDQQEFAITPICDQNHQACRKCVNGLVQFNSKCPYCFQPALKPDGQQGWNRNQGQPQAYANNAHWQPASGQPQPPPIVINNLGPNPQPLLVSPLVPKQGDPLKYLLFSLFFLAIAIVFLVLRIKMDSCTYWGALDCGLQQGSRVCCDVSCKDYPSSKCGFLVFYENWIKEIGTDIAIGLSGITAIGLFMTFVRRKRMQRLQNQYTAMAS